MSDVEFENTVIPTSNKYRKQTNSGGITGSLIKSGLAKSESQATMILVVVIILALALAGLFTFKATNDGPNFPAEGFPDQQP